MFMTPGALLVCLRFLSSTPATPESTFLRSDVSADMIVIVNESIGYVEMCSTVDMSI